MPTVEPIKGIKKYEFRLQVEQSALKPEVMKALRNEIESAVKSSKTEFHDWGFEVVFGEPS
jgi:hypothetical protein